jgi:hypothetical protein
MRATGLDAAGVSAQAARALEASAAGDRDVVALMTSPQPTPPAFDPGRLNSQDKDALVDALEARSAWLANIARALLAT